jgi:hypothetical protein
MSGDVLIGVVLWVWLVYCIVHKPRLLKTCECPVDIMQGRETSPSCPRHGQAPEPYRSPLDRVHERYVAGDIDEAELEDQLEMAVAFEVRMEALDPHWKTSDFSQRVQHARILMDECKAVPTDEAGYIPL